MLEVHNKVHLNLNILIIIYLFSLSANATEKKLIEPSKVKEISYLLASSTGVGRSSFGHSYIRVSYQSELKKNDDVIEFVADVIDPANIEYLRAFGFYNNYNFKINKDTYHKVWHHHVIKQNRDLTTYVLKLTAKQKDKLIETLNEILVNGTPKRYSFFKNNCADIVTDIFNSSFERPIIGSASFVPTMIPIRLKTLDLIKSTHIDPRKTQLIENIVKKGLEELDSHFLSELDVAVLISNLSSDSLAQRMQGYYALHILNNKFELKNSLKIISIIADLIKFENRFTGQYLSKLFRTKKIKIDLILNKKLSFNSGSIKKLRFYRLIHKNEDVLLQVNYSQKLPDDKIINRNKNIYLPELFYKDGKIIHKKTKVSVALNLGHELIEDKFYLPHSFLDIRLIHHESLDVISIFFSVKKEMFRENIDYKYHEGDELAYTNREITDLIGSGPGVCFSHSQLNRALILNAIFDPSQKELAPKANLELVKKALNGEFIVIPGFNNPENFTNSLNASELAMVLNDDFQEKYNWFKSSLAWFKETSITSSNFYIIKNLVDLGIPPVVAFKANDVYAHSVMITSITEGDNYYHLEVIDPNFKHIKKTFRFNKSNNKLITIWYGQVDLKLPFFQVDEVFKKALISHNATFKDLMMSSSKIHKNYSFTLSSLLSK